MASRAIGSSSRARLFSRSSVRSSDFLSQALPAISLLRAMVMVAKDVRVASAVPSQAVLLFQRKTGSRLRMQARSPLKAATTSKRVMKSKKTAKRSTSTVRTVYLPLPAKAVPQAEQAPAVQPDADAAGVGVAVVDRDPDRVQVAAAVSADHSKVDSKRAALIAQPFFILGSQAGISMAGIENA